ncbi:hypothetical protein [Paenibacillus sp. KS-LC4]|uniref:hypothetical protein n=1 Tax=Paenibacillus sp. KS-LC4 TaxID=2979727 RepID=UPI0030CAE6F2
MSDRSQNEQATRLLRSFVIITSKLLINNQYKNTKAQSTKHKAQSTKQQSNKATKQQSNKATKQQSTKHKAQGNKAQSTKQQSNKATKQQSNKATKHKKRQARRLDAFCALRMQNILQLAGMAS